MELDEYDRKDHDNKNISDEDGNTADEANFHYWQTDLYLKSYFTKRRDNNKIRYYDSSNFTKFLFFGWLTDWTKYISKQFVEPYKLHPLPVSDQILRWQPVFSKHFSDGLVRLESYQTLKSKGQKIAKNQYPYKSILLRALFLTFWKRTLFGLVGIVLTNILSISISILVKRLLEFLNDKTLSLIILILLIVSVVLVQITDRLISNNFRFLIYRLIAIIIYTLSITTFQHGLCYRRKYFNNIKGCNALNVCNSVLHSCSPDSECSKNPLFCPALRYQNRDLTPNIFILDFTDTFYISMFLESLVFIVDFLSSFIYGMILISYQARISLWILYVIGLITVVSMTLIEIISALMLKMIFKIRDYRISRCIYFLPSLGNINKSFYDDIALNIVTETRNKEMFFLFIRFILTYLNTTLYVVCINLSFYVLMRNFVKSIDNASFITDVDTDAFLSTLYIFIQIIASMFMVPLAIKTISNSCVSYNRIRLYLNTCSPNFYITDNKFTGTLELSSDVSEVTSDLDKDVIVLYKDATFTWVNSRKDLLTKNYQPYLKNVDFELRRGEIAIVTGVLGSGKSNFIKSVLGEMTLIGGSMAVVPLHLSMPIFYASEDIWIEQGTIRSNILFGHRFDENLYNTVLKAVELKSDISTWEEGDIRVVSNNDLSLSGGQRVRVEMARAIYAYLIFNQVNKQYNNNNCSLLICLDSSFHGIDPFVSKTVFNNLFNTKSGILVRDDLSVILTITKQSLDKCVSKSDLKQFANIPIYQIKNKRFTFLCYLSDYFSGNLHSAEYEYFSKSTVIQNINYLTTDLFDHCLSGSHKRLGRQLETKLKYQHSFKSYIKQTPVKTFNPYIVYLTPALTAFTIFILLTLALTILDNLKFVLASNLSDYITKQTNDFNDGEIIDLSEVKSKSNFYLNVVVIFILIIMTSSLVNSVLFSFACINSSRKVHEYCINSIFKNSSSVIKIKNRINHVITYFSGDVSIMDEDSNDSIYTSLGSFIHMFIHIISYFYLIPVSIPFLFVSMSLLYKFVFTRYVGSYKNVQYSYLESSGNVNGISEIAISGSRTYRSFKREWVNMDHFVEHSSYKARCLFLLFSLSTWASILFNWLFSLTTMITLVTQLILNKTTNFNLKIGFFGLVLSFNASVIRSFTQFSFGFAKLQMCICSMRRLQYFVPPGLKCVFGKYINTHEEDLVVNPTHDVYKITKKQLLKRRSNEFNENSIRFNCFKRVLYKPKINIIDVTQYLPAEHKGLGLHNVYVYTSPDVQNEKAIILNNVTASAHRSDIIGIIGRTGAGKTTLLTAIQNCATNKTGKVLLDGTDLNDIPKNVTRQIIGVIPQLPFVFKGWTVRRFLDPRKLFSDDQINQALDMCGLLQFVNDLQGGNKLDSIIINEEIHLDKHESQTSKQPDKDVTTCKSEKSSSLDTLQTYYHDADMLLSGNQLRTLSFARLLLYRYFYRVIIVDEPPTEDSEQSQNNQEIVIPIYELLRKYFSHCTSFVTAHEASVLQLCNSVWVIHEGHLIRKCKKEDISVNEPVLNIIEDILKKESRC